MDVQEPRQEPAEPCPDLTDLSLAELREAQHPVLDAVLADLREREERPGEMLWGFNSAL
ncbi:FxSxx-COOH cyclophane-containing RiPP peptide [Streptomyces endophyticus]|uniref:FxSxx-COOH protein n=1 Tax=Streptomyces endophyticus TaxID=714166 RepID=A0ABU6EWX4_9ACTN|nr:FxSxx-COOH cyclophane-containing RiPP peptide [Streptomyces endophyticus]MEB8336248.1 FxSxx-COOH protein [Streptomyces endophyticus]